jgi:phosphoglycerate kinase
MRKMLVSDLDLKGKKVLIRVDYNVPLDKSGKITDTSRIQASLPTIKYVLEKGGYPVLMSHLGRPKGKPVLEMSLGPCVQVLSDLLDKPVFMAPGCIGEKVEKLVKEMKPGHVVLLENLRFHDAEEHPEKDPAFAEKLAKLGDCYVNDAFGTAHRAHSSTATITQYFPGKSAMGFLVEKEIKFLHDTFTSPRRPFIAIIGGAKVSTKLGVIKSLLKKADCLLIGGGMAYTFLKAQGVSIGNSLVENDLVDTAEDVLRSFEKAGVSLQLPIDHIIADQISNSAQMRTVTSEEGIPPGFQGVDIGPLTIEEFKSQISIGKTVFWNGPLGIFEVPNFAKGTYAIADAVSNLSGTKIVGGGDSVSAIQHANLAHKISHLSTGGGASLEFIEFGTLPGIEALSDKE